MSKGLGITDTDLFSKESSVREWVRRKLGGVAHELRVARVAEMLFQLTRRWHDLGRAESRLLTLAALVHDVGRAQGEAGHAKAGARMLLENTSLPLTETERRRLAFLIRHHRGRVPEVGAERYLDRDADNGFIMRTLLGLLRAADTLDSRSLGSPQLVATVRDRVVTIYGYIAGDAAVAAASLGKPKKFRLLESMLDCRVQTEWFSTDRLAMVS
jgi:exopolyphosphatase/pppGpp-phosphohydrolase